MHAFASRGFVSVIPARPIAVRSLQQFPFHAISSTVRRSTRIGPWTDFFLLYTADLMKLITTNGLRPHIYADDTQIYGFCAPTATQALLDQVAACISDASSWMKSNRLQLNTDKTEALLRGAFPLVINI